MKRLTYLFFGLAMTSVSGCIVYPRFGHVYTTPDYHVLVVGNNNRPVAKATVSVVNAWGNHVEAVTNESGLAYLPAQRKFRVFDMFIMDPALIFSTASFQGDTAQGRARHFARGRHKRIIIDTIKIVSAG